MTPSGERGRSSGRDARLLLVVDSPDGGLAAVASRHREWFEGRGWQVSVAGPEPGPGSQAIPDEVVPIPASVRNVGAVRAAARSLRAIVRRDHPDVVHCHGPRSLVVCRLALTRRPFVTIHGTGAVRSDPVGYHRLRSLVVPNLPRLAQAGFTAAPELAPPWRFVAHASPRLPSLPQLPVPEEGPPTFLWMARLDEGRSPSTFVRAIADLSVRRRVRGVVAGTGPDLPEVRRLADALGAPIDFVGHADPASVLAECWALVLLSSHEAVNFAVQEAMWSGRAAVTSSLPGLAWLAGDTARFVSGVDDLVEALAELSEPGVAAARGAEAAARIRQVLHPDDPWPTIEAAYGRTTSSAR